MEFDKIIRGIWKNRNNIMWKPFEPLSMYGWYYAEERVYCIKNMITGVIAIGEGENPDDALEMVLNL